jgi:valyl-tRNA synthetase
MQKMMMLQQRRQQSKLLSRISHHTIFTQKRYHSTQFINKKNVSSEMADAYHPQQVESEWYQFWESNGLFKPSSQRNQKPYSITVPPPNVTGSLHIGHALTLALQDCLSRYKKMDNYRVVYVPGMDHAGISTQVVVEKKLAREQNGKTRHDVGRDAFIELVWKWKEEYGHKITDQMKAVGAMTDWSRHVFTMDENFSRAVIEAFVKLYEDGLIYRDVRLVAWCPTLKTAISDMEVEHKSLTGKTMITVPSAGNQKYEFGVLHTFKYPVVDDNSTIIGHIEVSTTRLETMLGDTAVAVHPDDERYKHFHGKYIQHPFITNRKIPIVCDSILVDMTFGTGVVKVTPAHSFEDFACGKRNNLEIITIMNQDGTLNENAGEFAGIGRFEVRKQLVRRLKELGLFVGEKDHPMDLPICDRSKDIIEPMLLPQWFVKCDTLAKRSLQATQSGEMKIYPSSYEPIWERWLTNIHDWCISRQLWWGHRIPAYRLAIKGEQSDQEKWIVATSLESAHEKVKQQYNLSDRNLYSLEQDEDVLDTWFSSGLYPIASFGWPDNTPELQDFYPLSVMETGSDILFFWVARMSMLCTYLHNGQQPFKDIYMHPMIRDAQGRKMSKSLGNVIDPIDVMHGITLKELQQGVIDNTNINPAETSRAIKVMEKEFPNGIQECGADALRFSLIKYTQQGRQINLDVQRVVAHRFFCNKIWQATRFATSHFDRLNYQARYGTADSVISTIFKDSKAGVFHNKWILSKLNQAIQQIRTGLDTYIFSDAATAIYNFFLYEFCDFYLEWVKPTLYNEVDSAERRETLNTLHICLEHSFRLMHPLMPYITEELWQRIPKLDSSIESIMLASYPNVYSQISNEMIREIDSQMELVTNVVQVLRSVKDSLQTAASKTDGYIVLHESVNSTNDNTDLSSLLEMYQSKIQDIEILSKFRSVQLVSAMDIDRLKSEQKKKLAVGIVNNNCSVYLTLPEDYLDKIHTEISKLKRKMEQLIQLQSKYEKQMNIPNYETNVPAPVRQKTQEKYNQTIVDISACGKSIEEMENLVTTH